MAAHQAIAETENQDDFVDELTPGTELMHGQYTIVSFLNSGGFGITYLAKDSLDRIVVIKECFPGNVCRRAGASVQPRSRAHQTELKSIVDLFTREAQNLAKADHPNIVGVHNVFEYNNTAYMALDYVKGRDLLDTITEDRESLTPDQIVKYLVNLLNAIGFIHGKGILHRDISPDNIIIDQRDEPVLIDFGAAREQATKKSRVLSQLRVVKDGYSPQEFYVSGSEQTEASDLYSLAASFYHIITGELPPDSQQRITAFASDEADPYVPLAQRTTEYSPAFCGALDKAMCVLPRDRVSSAEEWLAILEGSQPMPNMVQQGPNSRLIEIAPEVQTAEAQSKLPMLLGSTAVVALLGVGMYFALNSGGETEADTQVTETAVLDPAPVLIETPAPVEAPAPIETTAPIEVTEPVETIAPVETAGTDETTAADGSATDDTVAAQDVFAPDLLTAPPSIQAEPSPGTQPNPSLFADENAPVGDVVAALPATSDPIVFENRSDIADPAPVTEPTVAEETAPQIAALPAIEAPVAETTEPVVSENLDTDLAAPEVAPVNAAPEGALETITITPVMTASTPSLPFTLSDQQVGVITSAEPGARFWMTEGVQIASVDGVALEDNSQLLDALSQAPSDLRGMVSVPIGTKQPDSNIEIKRTLTVPLATSIALLNGITLESRPFDGSWATFVTGAPEGAQFQVGDRIIGFVETNELVDERLTFVELTRRELAEGRTNFSFALERNGEVWVESFTLAPLSN